MNRIVVRLLLVAALSTAVPAVLGAHCGSYRTSAPEAKAGAYYVDTDLCQPHCLWSVWIYEETNGIAGLQRSDSFSDDTCHGLIPSDRIVV